MISDEILDVKGNYTFSLQYIDNGFGRFGIFNSKTNLIHSGQSCREYFSRHFNKNTVYISYKYRNLNIKLLNEFWEKIENMLNLNNKTILYKTKNKKLVILKLSPFWVQDSTIRGFCTLFLRCGVVFYKGDFDRAIGKYNLSNIIKETIYWFLKGNTKIKTKVTGSNIVNYFNEYYYPKRYKQKLIKP